MLVVAALAFVSASLMVFASSVAVADRWGVKRSLRSLDSYGVQSEVVSLSKRELARPFADRVIGPAMSRASRWARGVTPKGVLDHLSRQLMLAGSPRDMNLDRLLAIKVLGGAAGTAMGIALAAVVRPGYSRSIILTAVVMLAGFFAPDLWLRNTIAARKKSIGRALPDTLDLLTISVEAGLGFDAALSKVVTNTAGPLAEEFYRMLQEIRLGTSRADAFRNLGARTDVPELSAFVLAMLQADIFGISVGKILRVQASEMRTKRRQRAEEIAMKAPVKVVFPLILCIFPALLVVILGPAAIRIYTTLIGG